MKLPGLLKKLDMHKHEANVSFTYQTGIGGVVTICLLIAVLGYGITDLFMTMVKPYSYDIMISTHPLSQSIVMPLREILPGITLAEKNSLKSEP